MSNKAIPEAVRQDILERLKRAEREHNVKVLYAIESGSRAWGFASTNSDFDARFIYVHPKEYYLSIDLEKRRDVIEYEIVDEIDINGWDVRKALQLFWKSNPAIVEWLHSPIVYRDDGYFAQGLRDLLPVLYSAEKGIYHYRSIAKTQFHRNLLKPEVQLKKYFYVLRPLLAIRWIEAYQQHAPIEFDKLRTLIAHKTALNAAIEKLLIQKRSGTEKGVGAPVPIINEFIEQELARLEHFDKKPPERAGSISDLNDLFLKILNLNG